MSIAPSKAWAVIAMLLGLGVSIVCIRRFGVPSAPAADSDTPAARYDNVALTLVGLGSAVAVALAGRDMFQKLGAVDGSARLMHLFTYNYGRSWPDTLDFTGAIVAFTVIASLLSLGLCLPRLRRHATALFCAATVLWGAWGLDVYLYQCAPHWGQRETVMAYYKDRKRPDYPFVAYQMNWKGENFYTGNHVPAFVASGEKFKSWVDEQKAHGINVIYFTSEHGRSGSLKREIGDPPSFVEITDKKLNNKFFVARVTY